jgi:hypothetical protein
MNDDLDDVLRLDGGPFDGGEIERDLFGGPLPSVIVVPAESRHARYVLDINAGGPLYRFFPSAPRTPDEAHTAMLRAQHDQAREASRALIAEGRALLTSLRQTRRQMSDLRIELQEARLSGAMRGSGCHFSAGSRSGFEPFENV